MAGQFVAETQQNLATIEAKLFDAERELIRLSRLAPDAALRIELDKAEDSDRDIVKRLPEVRALVDRLQLARDAAEAAEQSRRNANIVQSDLARRKAVSAHLARALTALDKSSSALQASVANLADAIDAIRAAEATQPPDLRAAGFLSHAFTPSRINRLWVIECARLCEARGLDNPLYRNAPYVQDMRDQHGELHPMHEYLAAAIDRVKADLRTGASRVAERYAAASPGSVAGVSTGVPHSPAAPSANPSPTPKKAA